MTLEWLREQIAELKRKLTETAQAILDATDLDEKLEGLIGNFDKANRLIDSWVDEIFESNQQAVNRDSVTSQKFAEYHMKHIVSILENGNIQNAKDALFSHKKDINQRYFDNQNEIVKLKNKEKSFKTQITEFKNSLRDMFGLEE